MARSAPRPPEKDPLQELAQLALDLDLTALAQALPDLLGRAEKEALAYTAFVLTLLRTELAARRERSLTRGLRNSHLGTVEGLEGFDFTKRPQLDPKVVRELLNCLFVKECRNLILVGRSSLGKTRIAKAIIYAACIAGYSALCTTTAEMIEDLHASQADRSFPHALRRYVKPQVLLLDEFTHEPFDLKATTYLYRVVAARHRQGSIIVTANTGFTNWKALFPAESIAVATVDRLVDNSTILRFSGEPYRKPKEIVGAPIDE